MNTFTSLPFDLQEFILADMNQQTLVSLCLVSKALLNLSRPLLYRSIRIDMRFWGPTQVADEEEEDHASEGTPPSEGSEADVEPSEVSLYETFDLHPDWKLYVREMRVFLSQTVSVKGGKSELHALLSTLSNLRSLTLIDSFGLSYDSNVDDITDSCPPTVVSLDLGGLASSPTMTMKLLKKFPLLEKLAVGSIHVGGLFGYSSAAEGPQLTRLQTLDLPYPFETDPSSRCSRLLRSHSSLLTSTSSLCNPSFLPSSRLFTIFPFLEMLYLCRIHKATILPTSLRKSFRSSTDVSLSNH